MNVLMRVHEDAQIGFCWQLSRWLMGNYELVSSLIAPQALQQPSMEDLYLLWSEQKMTRFSRTKMDSNKGNSLDILLENDACSN